MRRMTANASGRFWVGLLGVLLATGSGALGQQPGGGGAGAKPKADKPALPTSLEDLLVAGLKDNPDIRVAEAKVREAEAELNRARLQATHKIITLHRGLEAQKALVVATEDELKRTQQVAGRDQTAVQAAQVKLVQARAKLAEIEAEIPYLIGKHPERQTALRHVDALYELSALRAVQEDLAKNYAQLFLRRHETAVQGTMAERIRKALSTPVQVNFKGSSAADIVKAFQKKVEGVPLRAVDALTDVHRRIDLHLEEPVPLAAALQLIEDTVPTLRCVIREYGILVTHKEFLPPGAMSVTEFWRSAAGKEKGEPAAPEKKK